MCILDTLNLFCQEYPDNQQNLIEKEVMGKYKIIVAEDEKFIARIISTFFRNNPNWETKVVENGLKVIELLAQDNYDLVLTDIYMPEMDGYTLIKEIHKRQLSVPIVVMTGEKLEKDLLVQFLNEGISKYIEKPFKKDMLSILEEVIIGERKKNISQSRFEDDEIERIKAKNNIMDNSLKNAINSYKSITKVDLSEIDLKVHYIFKPLSWLGGDFFAIKKYKNSTKIFIADIAGHDAGTSFFAVMLKMLFDELYMLEGEKILKIVNSKLLKTSSFERMCTALFIDINNDTNEVVITNAGHPSPIVIKENKANILSITGSNMLGIFDTPVFKTERLTLLPKNRLLFYTDGLFETTLTDESGARKHLTEEELLTIINIQTNDNFEKFLDEIYNNILTISNQKQLDDILLLGVEI